MKMKTGYSSLITVVLFVRFFLLFKDEFIQEEGSIYTRRRKESSHQLFLFVADSVNLRFSFLVLLFKVYIILYHEIGLFSRIALIST